VLKELASSLSGPLCSLFQRSLEHGSVPTDWKVGEVIPIFKKGKKDDPANYRPVSLTSVPSKVLESVVKDKIIEHFIETQQLNAAQHGFLPKHSCVTQLLSTLESLTSILEKGDGVDIIYLDFRKAFDSVPHLRLLQKLHDMGIRGRLLSWIRAFLCGREQRVMVSGTPSSWASVASGIPQGTVLGPTLFLAYINDLPNCVNNFIKMFADDAKLFGKAASNTDHEQLQADLHALTEWAGKWLLPFNTAKCCSLHLGSGNPRRSYLIQGTELEQKVVEKDLGVMVDQQLKFREQASAAVSKGN